MYSAKKINIRQLSLDEVTSLFEKKGEKKFRAKQLYDWIWKHSARSFEEMTNLPALLRGSLSEEYDLNAVTVESEQKSNDGTIKTIFKLADNNRVEGVLIPADDRMTACISSQVGCSLTCAFCATGRLERIRNLEAEEIYDQVVIIRNQAEKHFGMPLSNIVYMGMGEPLLNYSQVLRSIEHITSPAGLGMSAQRITVSTAGIAKSIKKLGDDGVKFNLAVSLHAANDIKRSKIMPINEQNSLIILKESLLYFYKKTGTKVTYEYIIFNNFNDTLEDAAELAAFAKVIPCKVNIIEYNPIERGSYSNATPEKTESFRAFLEANGIIVNVSRSRGKDIDAACGQLAMKGNNVQLKNI